MLTWETLYREDLSPYIKAKDEWAEYKFTTHSIERMFDRSSNLKRSYDLEKPIRRIVKCITNYRVDSWIMEHQLGTKLLIHDTDIHMLYIIICRGNKYEIISTYNEFWSKYNNTHNTPELWVSLNK